MKRLLCVFSMVLLLSGCFLNPSRPYEFRQEIYKISRIEILKQEDELTVWEYRFVVRKMLDETEFESFLSELTTIPGQPFINPPNTLFGKFVIRITYADGEEEYISRNNNGYVLPGKALKLDTYYFLDGEGFYNLISKYLGEDISDEVEP